MVCKLRTFNEALISTSFHSASAWPEVIWSRKRIVAQEAARHVRSRHGGAAALRGSSPAGSYHTGEAIREKVNRGQSGEQFQQPRKVHGSKALLLTRNTERGVSLRAE